jgi:hypothetical protein
LKIPIHVRAATPEEAHFLAFRALRRIVGCSDLRLKDRKGNPVDLPCPPKLPSFKDEPHRSSSARERPHKKIHGATLKTFRKTYLVRGADGSLGHFKVFVGKPEKVSEQEYKSRVFCSVLKRPICIRFVNPERAYFLAFRAVEDLLEHSGLQLAGRKGTPVEFPCPPEPPVFDR